MTLGRFHKQEKKVKTISKLALPMTLLAGLYLLISGNLFSLNLFLGLQVLAIAVLPWARRSFQPGQFNIHETPKDGVLISSGPFKYIRHPMYASALAIIWSGIAGHFSYLNLAIGIFITVVVFIRISIEEQYLHASYQGYGDYSQKTRLIIPYIL